MSPVACAEGLGGAAGRAAVADAFGQGKPWRWLQASLVLLANTLRFTGRLANHKLHRGSYTLTATPTLNRRTGRAATTTFQIRR